MSNVGAHGLRVNEFLKRFDADDYCLEGVEVGVFQATGAFALLSTFTKMHLYLVDQWLPSARYIATGDPTAPHVGDKTYLDVYTRVRDFNLTSMEYGVQETPCATVIRASSVAVASIFNDATVWPTGAKSGLSFVFIDAEHTFEAVMEDCRAWWPKVKSGGWLCGHDYGCDPIHTHVAGVTKAVDQFAAEVGGVVETIGEAGDFTWWLRKP